jgi:D-tyrosyl-tRNA(Tyr) deacylase
MRVLVQEVLKASVTIDAKEVASIGRGFLLFVGFTQGDNQAIIGKMVDKIMKLRIFPDENGKTNLSLAQVNGQILSVSQFTLYGALKEGNRPSFVDALNPNDARILYAYFNNLLKEKMPSLQTGVFQADMKVSLINDGPFTLMLDSKELFA